MSREITPYFEVAMGCSKSVNVYQQSVMCHTVHVTTVPYQNMPHKSVYAHLKCCQTFRLCGSDQYLINDVSNAMARSSEIILP